MGLDWVLQCPPKLGKENEYKHTVNKLDGLNDSNVDEREQLMKLRDSLTVSPGEALGAPRIGFDAEANEFLLKQRDAFLKNPDAYQNAEHYKYWNRSMCSIIKDEHGLYVMELCKNPEGLAPCSGIAVGRESFRGKIIGNTEWLGSPLQDRAYSNMGTTEMEAYANQLENKLWEHSGIAVADVKQPRGSVDPEEMWEIFYVAAAVKWLRFWSAKGFTVYAWS